MPSPLKLEEILSELADDSEAWVLQDRKSGDYVTIPDNRYPGRKPIRFFLKQEDAQDVLIELLDANPALRGKDIFPVKVKLIPALRGIAADTNPDHADAFVIHGPAEVYEYIRDRQ